MDLFFFYPFVFVFFYLFKNIYFIKEKSLQPLLMCQKSKNHELKGVVGNVVQEDFV